MAKQLVVKRKNRSPEGAQIQQKIVASKTTDKRSEKDLSPGSDLDKGVKNSQEQDAFINDKKRNREILITKSVKMTPELSKKIKTYSAIHEVFESDLVAGAMEKYFQEKNFSL